LAFSSYPFSYLVNDFTSSCWLFILNYLCSCKRCEVYLPMDICTDMSFLQASGLST
jgi:hypothetical protein